MSASGLGHLAARCGNAWRRLRHGLPARGGPVSPEVGNDLFVAHLAFYDFAARFARGGRVLDLGCGTGYGSAHLLAAGAREVVGLDSDEALLAYARRRFPAAGLRFVYGRAEVAAGAGAGGGAEAGVGAGFDLVVAGNLLPHLRKPDAVVAVAAERLGPAGVFVASVPPIADDRTMDQHRASGLHPSNLYLWDWESMLRRCFAELRMYQLTPPAGAPIDFSDPRRSRLPLAGFSAAELDPARLDAAGSLTAIFVASRAPLAPTPGR